MKKKSNVRCMVSLFVVLCLILTTIVIPASATNQISNNPVEKFVSDVEIFLSESVFSFPDAYKISQFSDFFLGKEIPSYIWDEETNCVVKSPANVYPLIKNGIVLGLLHAYPLETGEYAFSYSEGEADALNQAYDNVAFYSDGRSVYILQESDSTLAEESIFKSVAYSSPYEEYLYLNVYADKCVAYSFYSLPDGHILSVPKMQQPSSLTCWAACVASIAQYLTNRTYAPISIVINSGIFGTATMDETIETIRNLGLTSTDVITSISLADLMNYICDDCPILGGFATPSNDIGHMMVIRGYSSGSNHFTMLLMDPSDASYVSVNVISSIDMSFSYGGYSWILDECAAVS